MQLGWNAGARHVTIFGLAKSYVKEIGKNAMIVRDKDAVAVLSIMWGLVGSLIPEEVVSEVNMRLDMEGMPRMATRNVEPGRYYSLLMGSSDMYDCFQDLGTSLPLMESFTVFLIERAPPEGYE